MDWTEHFCQSLSSLKTQSRLNSDYKHHINYKGLVDISPSGTILFTCQLYDVSISGKVVAAKNGPSPLKKMWFLHGRKGFLIADDLKKMLN